MTVRGARISLHSILHSLPVSYEASDGILYRGDQQDEFLKSIGAVQSVREVIREEDGSRHAQRSKTLVLFPGIVSLCIVFRPSF